MLWYSKKIIKFCCEQFKYNLSLTEERGISIFITPPNEYLKEPAFFLLSRGIDKNDTHKLLADINNCKAIINITTTTGIIHCPWCGIKLSKFYKNIYQELINEEILKELRDIE
jgi:hypothetical protein